MSTTEGICALAPSSLVGLLRLITQGEAHGGSGMESSILLGSSLPQAGPQQKQLFRVPVLQPQMSASSALYEGDQACGTHHWDQCRICVSAGS